MIDNFKSQVERMKSWAGIWTSPFLPCSLLIAVPTLALVMFIIFLPLVYLPFVIAVSEFCFYSLQATCFKIVLKTRVNYEHA